MEQKHVEERSLVLEPPSRRHWTTIFTQVLLFFSLLSYLLLGGLIVPHLFSGTGFATMLAVSVWGLALLLCVLLCVVSGVAYAHARQWRRGRLLAIWGLVVGILGVFLVVGAFILFMNFGTPI